MMALPKCPCCGEEATVFFPGDEAEMWPGGIVVTRPRDGFGLCLKAARKRGWPGQLGQADLDLWPPTAPRSEDEMITNEFEEIVRKLDRLIGTDHCLAERLERLLRHVDTRRTGVVLPELLLVNSETRRLIVANIQLPNDQIVEYPIVALDAGGQVVPAPAGDTYSVTNGAPTELNSVIGTLSSASADGIPAGSPAVILNALVPAATGITLTVSDSAGLGLFNGAVDIVPDLMPKNLGLDVTDPVVQGSQAVPA